MATVTLSNLVKTFGLVEVIKGVSLQIAHGEFVALVGPSGCGKSTLLRMIAGLEDVSSGEITIDDRVVTDVPAKARDIAMVFQNYALYPHMTVAQNLAFALKMRKTNKAEIGRRVFKVAESLNLVELLDRYPKQLSGGQRQRVATGRAIIRDPRVFLFDEPLSNLDAKLRVQVRAELRQLHRRLGVTTIYVTHDQIEAMTMADKIVVLRDGQTEQVGEPLELYDHPNNSFVATFIGSPAMNLIEGSYRDGSIILADGGILPLDVNLGLDRDTRLTVGVRPEHLEIVAGDASGVEVKLIALEPTGAETMVIVELAGQPITLVTKERLSFRLGDALRVQSLPMKQHFFGADGCRVVER